MAVRTVAILSPGDMGSNVGRVLVEHGLDVVTCLDGRSERTAGLAAAAGIRPLATIEEVVGAADLILAILVPSEAMALARRVAEAIGRTGALPAYADCNAISPDRVRAVGAVLAEAGARFIDVGIIGPPPGKGRRPRFYASGGHAPIMAELDGMGIEVPVIGGEIGRASGIKMCYAAVTKGTQALHAAALTVAESMDLSEEFRNEVAHSQPAAFKAMEQVNTISGKAFRWVGEMEEIAATFESAGATGKFHHGAADTFRMIAASPIGDERPETIDPSRSLEDTVRIFARSLRAAAA